MSTDGQERESPSSAMGLSRSPASSPDHDVVTNKTAVRPSGAQRRYLERGLDQPGGKLPLFDREGRQVPIKTVQSCIEHGWAEPWTRNPIKPDWLVCRLSAAGYDVLGRAVPHRGDGFAQETGS
jgi:hypothetical protein